MTPEKPAPYFMTADEALAVQSRVVDCEWKAAGRYDDGGSVAQLAQRIMGICGVELIKARKAFRFSLDDPLIEQDEFKMAVGIVEDVRKGRRAK